ncbi:MAG: hypothetical protein R3E96_08255 [Planctomycetota bacterium]
MTWVLPAAAGSSFPEERGHVGEYHTPVEEDPFRIPLSEKIELLRAAEAATHCRSEVVAGEPMLSLRREEQWQSSSEGARLHQVLVRVGAHVTATAAANGHVELRSHPAYGGQYLSGGYEHVRRMDLLGAAPRMGEEAVALCRADLPGQERYDDPRREPARPATTNRSGTPARWTVSRVTRSISAGRRSCGPRPKATCSTAANT